MTSLFVPASSVIRFDTHFLLHSSTMSFSLQQLLPALLKFITDRKISSMGTLHMLQVYLTDILYLSLGVPHGFLLWTSLLCCVCLRTHLTSNLAKCPSLLTFHCWAGTWHAEAPWFWLFDVYSFGKKRWRHQNNTLCLSM